MDGKQGDILSLRNHLMNWLFTPLFVLWVFSTATGYVATVKYANRPYDQALLERAQLLAGQWRLAQGASVLPPPRETASYFFTLYGPDGAVLAGNAHLPRPAEFLLEKPVPLFTDVQFRGARLRMVTLLYAAQPGGTLQLQVAESVENRQALIRGILANIVIPQLLLILMAGAAVWYALKRGWPE